MKKGERFIRIPDHLLKFMEWYFGVSFRQVRFYESDTLHTHHAYAYARGNEVHIGIKDFNADTLYGVALIGHELTHIIQQSKMTKLHNLLSGSRALEEEILEKEAVYHSYHIVVLYQKLFSLFKKPNIRKLTELQVNRKISFMPCKLAPMQFWQVGGISSYLKQALSFKIKELSGSDVCNDIEATEKGVHETFTRLGMEELKTILSKYSQHTFYDQNVIENLVFGSRFNDVGIYSNIMFALIYALSCVEFDVEEEAKNTPPYSITNILGKVGNSFVWTGRARETPLIDSLQDYGNFLKDPFNNLPSDFKATDVFVKYHLDDIGYKADIINEYFRSQILPINMSKLIIPKDEYIEQSHEGCMQFLHSMDTSKGKLLRNVEKMCRWAEFCIDVYENKEVTITANYVNAVNGNCNVKAGDKVKFQNLNLARYVLSIEETDILACMLSTFLLKTSKNKEYEKKEEKQCAERKKKDQEILIGKTREGGFLEKYLDYLQKYDNSKIEINDVYKMELGKVKEIREAFKNTKDAVKNLASVYGGEKVSIGTFFGRILYGNSDKTLENIVTVVPGLVAMGTVCHMVQDSFSDSHTRRAYEKKDHRKEYVSEAEKCNTANKIDQAMENLRAQLIEDIPPIILCTDYRSQDSARHGFADNLMKDMGTEKSDVKQQQIKQEQDLSVLSKEVEETRGAVFARECTAHILYMTLTGKTKEQILSFIKQIYKLPSVKLHQTQTLVQQYNYTIAEDVKQFDLASLVTSAGGYPYEYIRTEWFLPYYRGKYVSEIVQYQSITLTRCAKNYKETGCSNRLNYIAEQLSYLNDLIVHLKSEFNCYVKDYQLAQRRIDAAIKPHFVKEGMEIAELIPFEDAKKAQVNMEKVANILFKFKKHVQEMMMEIMLIANLYLNGDCYLKRKEILPNFNKCKKNLDSLFLEFEGKDTEGFYILQKIEEELKN